MKPLQCSTKLQQTGTLWIAADLHLGPDAPATTAAFLTFLQEASTQTDALFLCGDIFNAWIGDDLCQQAPAWLEQICSALREYSHHHSLYLMRGNRDFLLGPNFARYVNAQLLPEQVLVQSDAGLILLSHGDELCTDDVAYQRFRRIVRWPWLQSSYLSLPLTWRQAIANYFRRKSQRQNKAKPSYIMDVSSQAATHQASSYQVNALIHGHTHRPAQHVLQQNPLVYRWVLPDWDYEQDQRGGYISIQAGRICLQQYQHAPLCQMMSDSPTNNAAATASAP